MLKGGRAARRWVHSLQQCARFFLLFVWPCSLRDYYSVSNRPFDRGTNLITIFPQSPIPFAMFASNRCGTSTAREGADAKLAQSIADLIRRHEQL